MYVCVSLVSIVINVGRESLFFRVVLAVALSKMKCVVDCRPLFSAIFMYVQSLGRDSDLYAALQSQFCPSAYALRMCVSFE